MEDIETKYQETCKELEIYKKLINCCFHLQINMNDAFFWACADSEEIDSDEIEELMPFFKKYGVWDVLMAHTTIKRGYESNHTDIRDTVRPIVEELKPLADKGEILWDQFYEKEKIKKDKLEFDGQHVEYDNPLVKRIEKRRMKYVLQKGDYYHQAIRAKLQDGTFAFGYSYGQARERLVQKYKKIKVAKPPKPRLNLWGRIKKWYGKAKIR